MQYEVIVQTPTSLADEVRGIVEQAMIDGIQILLVKCQSLLRLWWQELGGEVSINIDKH